MPALTRLLTLLHVSDLHVGDIDPSSGDALISKAFGKLVSNSTWFDGLLGHHSRGLEHLEKFWGELRRTDAEAKLVVSGDVTRCGGTVELDNAESFLSAKLSLPVGQIGLGVATWRDHTIPGNHDHWPGNARIFGGPNPAVVPRLIVPNPTVQVLKSGGKTVQLININTDAGVRPNGFQRIFGIGEFRRELANVKVILSGMPEFDVRVLLMHHSWHKKGLLRISRGSRAALAQFLDQENIHIVLTGHVHDPAVVRFAPPGTKWTVTECRCGTTTQMDKMAYDAKTLFGHFPRRPDWPSNSLLVHRLFADSAGKLFWRVNTYVRLRSGFTDMGKKGMKDIPIP